MMCYKVRGHGRGKGLGGGRRCCFCMAAVGWQVSRLVYAADGDDDDLLVNYLPLQCVMKAHLQTGLIMLS